MNNNNNKVSGRPVPLTLHLGESKVINGGSKNDYNSFRLTAMTCISITELYIILKLLYWSPKLLILPVTVWISSGSKVEISYFFLHKNIFIYMISDKKF